MSDDLVSRAWLKKHKFTTQVCNGVEIESVDVVAVATIDNAPQVKPQKIAYICDGTACDPERASCKLGGPCHHTTQIEHARHFYKLEDSDGWFETELTQDEYKRLKP